MKSYLSEFILVSVLTVSALGLFESERHTSTMNIDVRGEHNTSLVNDKVMNDISLDYSDSRSTRPASEDDFSFEFPNIFHVFRSII